MSHPQTTRRAGYTPSTVIKALTALGHLGRWMEREQIDVDQLDDGVVSQLSGAQVRVRGRLPLASVRPLLEYLRAAGVVAAEPAGPVTAADHLVEGYREWLLVERGLAPSTVRSSERLARRFLADQISAHDATEPEITGADVTAFLVRESKRLSPRSAGCVACQLRSLLRYRAARGLADPGLVDAVPRIALWRDSAIPQFPAPAAVDALLASCDQSSVVGARDYAVLMLLARLGLRAIEVSRLELSDLDWRAGEIELDGKAHQRGRLPLHSRTACYGSRKPARRHYSGRNIGRGRALPRGRHKVKTVSRDVDRKRALRSATGAGGLGA